jgi:hypothetical protein
MSIKYRIIKKFDLSYYKQEAFVVQKIYYLFNLIPIHINYLSSLFSTEPYYFHFSSKPWPFASEKEALQAIEFYINKKQKRAIKHSVIRVINPRDYED